MKKKYAAKLTAQEAKRLEDFINKNGGQVPTSAILGVMPETLSRNINRHTSPSRLLRAKLIEHGILKA